MAKFGELIDLDIPVLIDFYREVETTSLDTVLNEVAQEMGKAAKVVKIEIDKNQKLSEALKIKEVPTLVIYKNGEMVWRKNGPEKKEIIMAALKKHS